MSSSADSNVKKYYEKYWTEVGAYSRPLGPRLLRLLETHLRFDSRILEVGCGTGRATGHWVHERCAEYIGVDISENAVNEARNFGLNARAIEDASSLPFEDEGFDLVLCLEVLEHLFEPRMAAQEILRVLRPNGVLIASVPNLAYWQNRLLFLTIGRFDPAGDALSKEEPWRDPHIRFFNRQVLKRMLSVVGFHSVHVFGEEPTRLRRLPWVGEFLNDPSTAVFLPTCLSHNLVAEACKQPVAYR